MITYLYWAAVIGLTAAVLFSVGVKAKKWKAGLIIAILILTIGWGAYAFHFQQIFVKRYGGVMTISVPDGQRHMGATWKDDNLWIENYDPKTNTCIFSEYSKGSVLEGKVVIKNCNPLMPGR
ncbi:MAG: hypothetical protein J7K96_10520 [Desulfobacteraceae bacterium]|nr:hypothetical protein [Desulfobacteraceae bacterium]